MELGFRGEEAGRWVFCSCEDDGRPSIGNGRPGAVGSTQWSGPRLAGRVRCAAAGPPAQAGAERAQAAEPLAGLFCARAA